jgi:hypothetical protein
MTSNENNIPSWSQPAYIRLHCASQNAFRPISLDCLSHRAPGGHAYAHRLFVGGKGYQHHQRVGIRLAGLPHPLKIARSAQSKLAVN